MIDYKLLTPDMIRNLNIGDLVYDAKNNTTKEVDVVGNGRAILTNGTQVHSNTHGNNFYLVTPTDNSSGGRKSRKSRKSRKTRQSKKSRKSRKSRKM